MAVTLEELKQGAESFYNSLEDEAKKEGSAIELYCLELAKHLESRHGELAGNSDEKAPELDLSNDNNDNNDNNGKSEMVGGTD